MYIYGVHRNSSVPANNVSRSTLGNQCILMTSVCHLSTLIEHRAEYYKPEYSSSCAGEHDLTVFQCPLSTHWISSSPHLSQTPWITILHEYWFSLDYTFWTQYVVLVSPFLTSVNIVFPVLSIAFYISVHTIISSTEKHSIVYAYHTLCSFLSWWASRITQFFPAHSVRSEF